MVMRFLNVLLLLAVIYLGLAHSARIVVLYPVGSKSHFFGVKPAIEVLAERGHQVTLFTPFPDIGKGIKNVNEVILSETKRIIEEEIVIDWFAMQRDGNFQILKMFSMMAEFTRKGAKETLQNQEFRRIIAERDVDLFVVDGFGNEFVYPVIDLTGVPFVTHCASSPLPMLLATLGGPPEYASVPSPFTDFEDHMTFFQRFQNLLMAQVFKLIRDIHFVPSMDRLVKEEYPQAKSILDVETEVSVTIVNSHPTTTFPRSLPPTVIPIGALHTRPAKKLPQDLKKFADESKHGFIVFTLGSFVPVSSMPKETAQSFMRVFSKLPLNVVWKWETTIPEDVPLNVLMVDWIPQQDLLGHPNAKLFITHGGMMGTQEAIYHGVPILGLPFGNDQRANIVKPKRDGFAIKLDWDKLNDDVLFSAISHLIYDPKVRESAAKASQLMRDEMLPGKDLAVYWMEYVMRNNGTKHLQLASKNMPFYKVYLLDVISFFVLTFSVVSYGIFLLLRMVFQRYVFAGQLKKTKTS